MEEFEEKGYWWLPNEPKKTIPGIIKYSQKDGIELNLFDVFVHDRENFDIIHGRVSSGKLFTLVDSYEYSRSMSFPGFPLSDFHSKYCIIGEAHLDMETLKFKIVEFKFSLIDEWLNYNDQITTNSFNIRRPKKLKLQYEIPESIKVIHEDEITISNTAYINKYKFQQNKSQITQSSVCKINLKTNAHIYEIVKKCSVILRLAEFSCQKDIHFTAIILKEANRKVEYNSIYTLCFHQKYRKYKIDKITSYDFLINRSQLKDKFSQYVEKWVINFDKYKSALFPFLSTIGAEGFLVEDLFLNLCKSIEALHREHIGLINIRTNKEYTLAQRVKEVLVTINNSYQSAFSIDDIDIFVRKIIKFRRGFTHAKTEVYEEEIRISQIHYLYQKLSVIFNCYYLMILGFTQEEVTRFISETRLYNHLGDIED